MITVKNHRGDEITVSGGSLRSACEIIMPILRDGGEFIRTTNEKLECQLVVLNKKVVDWQDSPIHSVYLVRRTTLFEALVLAPIISEDFVVVISDLDFELETGDVD